MISGDRWGRELSIVEADCIRTAECLRQRDQHQKGSRAFIRENKEIRNKLYSIKQQLQELTSLLNQQSITGEITELEANRRQGLLQKAENRYQDLEKQSTATPKETYFRQELLGDEAKLEPTISWGEAGNENVATAQERIQAQQQYMQDQDAGLDQLTAIMSRTKTVAQDFTTEINLHNEILDDVGDQMESVNARLIRNTRRTEQLGRTSDTCGLWLIIVALLIAIVVVAVAL